jgi:peptide/nickel transport system substrate-binding protein
MLATVGRWFKQSSLQVYAALVSLPLILALAACSSPPDDMLRVGLASAPITLDPRFATDATSTRINRLLYVRLVDFDEQLQPKPSLATWEIISATHYRFRLNPQRAAFHNGSLLTARDVKATYDYILDPENASPHRTALALIDAIDVIDDDTLDFYLSRQDALFPGYLVVGILPQDEIHAGHRFNRRPMGSGAFVFERWPSDGELVLRRKRDHQQVVFQAISDPTVRVLKLLRGEIDLVQNDLSPELIKFLSQQPGIQVQHRPGSNFSYLGFNLEDDVLRSRDIRQAIAYAIDRKDVIRYVMGGAARPANALLPPDHWAGLKSSAGYAYDPEKARQLLARHGYGKEHPLTISYKTSTDSFRVRLATVLQSQLAQVGIKVNLQSYDWGTFYGDVKAGNFQMYSLAWVGIKTPDIFRYVFYSQSIPPNGANRGRLRDERVDKLIEEAESKSSLEDKAALYQRLQAYLLQELPYVPLWYEDHVFAARKNITGYTMSHDGDYDGLLTAVKK